MDERDWMKSLKVGDEVVLSCFSTKVVCSVDEITKDGLLKINGWHFDRNGTGNATNEKLPVFILKITDEAIEEMRQKEAISKARFLLNKTSNLTYDQAVKVIEMFGGKSDGTI